MDDLTPSLDSLRNSLGRTYGLSNRVLVDTEPAPEVLAAHYRATCESGKGCDESVIAVGSPFWCNHAKPLQLNSRNFRNAILAESTLCQADLSYAKLHEADLWNAELHGAELWGAELHGADLWGAELHGANLSFAELHGADLSGAKLHGANLSDAKLHGADLILAELHGADLWRAQLHEAELSFAELHGASSHQDFHESFEEAINKRIGKQSDLSRAIFAGGLSRKDVASIGQGLPDEDANELRAKLEAHIGSPESHELPDNSVATGAYREEAAAEWIAEYKTAMSGGG